MHVLNISHCLLLPIGDLVISCAHNLLWMMIADARVSGKQDWGFVEIKSLELQMNVCCIVQNTQAHTRHGLL